MLRFDVRMQTCNLSFLLLTYDKADFRFIFIYVCMNEYHLVQVCQRPELGIRCLGTRVTDSCDLPSMGAKNQI